MVDEQITPLAAWIETTPMHRFMNDVPVAFTAAETLHFMGLTVLFGVLLVVDLRGLGFLRRISLVEIHKLVPFAIGAFIVQLLTGIAFICSSPNHYFVDTAFQAKMITVVLAGINALVFEFAVFRPIKAGNAAIEHGTLIKVTSGLSILFWAFVLICGRLIPYW
jgi:hypothetical protein